jgi:ferredoxin
MAFAVLFELPDGSLQGIKAEAGEFVLDAAARAGLALPAGCRQGWDLACAARLLAGRLDHSAARRYYATDERAGFALVCRARACSDLRLRTHQAEAMRAARDRHGLPAPRGS